MSDFKKLQIKIKNRERDRKVVKEKKLDVLYKKLGMKTHTEHMQQIQDEKEFDYANTSLEKKQKFLDLMNAGKNLGEAREIVGITFDVACMIIMKNAVEMFPTKVIK